MKINNFTKMFIFLNITICFFSLNIYSQTNNLKLPYFEDFKKAFPDRDISTNDSDLLIKRMGKEVREYYDRTGNRNTCALRVSIGLNNSGLKIPINRYVFLGRDNSQNFLSASDMLEWMKKHFAPTKKIVLNDSMRQNNDVFSQLKGLKGIYMMIPIDNNSFGASGHADLFDGNCNGGCYVSDASEVYFWELPKRPVAQRRVYRPRNRRIG